MDKAQAMKVMAESHRETVEELEEQVYAISETYRQEREYNNKLDKENKRYREALKENKLMITEAIESLDNDEEVNGLEYGLKIIETVLRGDPHD